MFTFTSSTSAAVNAVRYSVKGVDMWDAFVVDNAITSDNVADAAKALAVLAYPKEDQKQTVNGKRTTFGNAVQAAGWNLREALKRQSPIVDDENDDDDDKAAPVVNLLTRAGLKADLETVIAAWNAANAAAK